MFHDLLHDLPADSAIVLADIIAFVSRLMSPAAVAPAVVVASAAATAVTQNIVAAVVVTAIARGRYYRTIPIEILQHAHNATRDNTPGQNGRQQPTV